MVHCIHCSFLKDYIQQQPSYASTKQCILGYCKPRKESLKLPYENPGISGNQLFVWYLCDLI